MAELVMDHVASLARRRVCGTLAFFGNGFGMGVWSIEIARVKTLIGVSEAGMGLALLVFAIAALAAMPVATRLAGRFRINRVCGAAGVVFAIALTLPGLATSLPMLCLALLGLGVGHGSLDVVMNSRASLVETAYGRPVMSSFHAAWSIGGAIGAGAAGVLTGIGCSASAIMGGSAVVVLCVLLGSFGGDQPSVPPARPAEEARSGRRAFQWNPRLIGLCVIAFCALFTEGALADWTSIYLEGALAGLSGGFAAGYVAFSVGMSAGRIGGDRAVARLGRRWVGLIGAAVSAAALSYVLWWPTLVSAGLCFVLIGLGMSNVVPITFSTAGRTARSASRGIAAAASAGYTGLLIGPVLVGGLADLFTLPQALIALIVGMVLVAAMATRVLER